MCSAANISSVESVAWVPSPVPNQTKPNHETFRSSNPQLAAAVPRQDLLRPSVVLDHFGIAADLTVALRSKNSSGE